MAPLSCFRLGHLYSFSETRVSGSLLNCHFALLASIEAEWWMQGSPGGGDCSYEIMAIARNLRFCHAIRTGSCVGTETRFAGRGCLGPINTTIHQLGSRATSKNWANRAVKGTNRADA